MRLAEGHRSGSRLKQLWRFVLPFLAGLLLFQAGLKAGRYYGVIQDTRMDENDFGIIRVKAAADYDADGIDDYTDFLMGARKDADRKPRYDGRYWSDGGYPPDDTGVCTDVIWRAFREAGYSLRDMVNQDIVKHPQAYPGVSTRDPNIDFRRVVNLRTFFGTYGQELTLDTEDISAWQPGDIVFFGEQHIGVVSDIRNEEGQPWIIHNSGQPLREENYLARAECTGHFRFNAELLGPEITVRWSEPGQ